MTQTERERYDEYKFIAQECLEFLFWLRQYEYADGTIQQRLNSLQQTIERYAESHS